MALSRVDSVIFMPIYFIILLSFHTIVVSSQSANDTTPVSDSSNKEEFVRYWKAAPKERGTSTVLQSCFITIGLAVWTTVIVNVQMAPSTTKNEITIAELYSQEKVVRIPLHSTRYYSSTTSRSW